MQARFTQFLLGEYFVYLSLCNPQSEKSCDIPFISVKLPKYMYSQRLSKNPKSVNLMLVVIDFITCEIAKIAID